MRFFGLVITTRKKFEKLTETHQIGRVQYSGHTFDSYMGSIGVLEKQNDELKVEYTVKLQRLLKSKGKVERLNMEAAQAIRRLIEENKQLNKKLKEAKRKRKDSLCKSIMKKRLSRVK